MTITFNNTTLADLLSELIELKNFISKLQYQIDGSYTQIDQGNNQISLDRIIELSGLLNEFDTTGLIESSEANISSILTLTQSLETKTSTILDIIQTILVPNIDDIINKLLGIRARSNDIIDILEIINDNLQSIRDTPKIVSHIPYKFDNLGTCEQRVAYLYDNGDVVDSSLNPITIASIEPDIGFCP